MSASTYREALVRLRDALDLLGPYRGKCGLCGWVDARHRSADSIAGGLLAGDTAEEVAADYLDGRTDAVRVVHEITIAVLAADPVRHRLTRDKASGIDQEVWGAFYDTRTSPGG